MPYKKDDIGKRIAGIDGVREVQNNIEVLPVSNFDDQLRYRIARAIYGNPSFWNYAAMANPPIHIIVEHGHVTLTGVVNSNVERMLARSLATGLGELSVENELRTDAESAQRVTSRVRRGPRRRWTSRRGVLCRPCSSSSQIEQAEERATAASERAGEEPQRAVEDRLAVHARPRSSIGPAVEPIGQLLLPRRGCCRAATVRLFRWSRCRARCAR